jgi:hypothetical protein
MVETAEARTARAWSFVVVICCGHSSSFFFQKNRLLSSFVVISFAVLRRPFARSQ